MKLKLTCLILALAALPAGAQIIALDNPVGVGNQNFPGGVGMDFNVGLNPLEITHLGAFDSGQDGFGTARTVSIYDRNNTAAPFVSITIPAGTAAPLINGSRFQALASAVTLPAGFKGSITINDVNVDGIHNQGVSPGPLSTINRGGGLLQFVGGGRFIVAPSGFPNTVDGGPANRYQAGTFQYQTTSATPKYIAYDVVPTLAGAQNFSGSIGMDFDVGSAGVQMTHIGVFDSNQDGLNTTINAYIYDRDTQSVFAGPFSFSGSADPLVNGSRMRDIADVLLPAGFHGSIVAEGYGATELLYNSGGTASLVRSVLGDGNGLISFTGSGRFGNAGAFPAGLDGGPANRYAAGTFAFMIPEPGTVGLLALCGVALGMRRKRRG